MIKFKKKYVILFLFVEKMRRKYQILILRFDEHNNFVKSVLVDPLGNFVGSFAQDRSIRMYNYSTQKSNPSAKLAKVISKVII